MAVVAGVTLFTRILPFALFGGKKGMPKMIGYLGKVLPAAIIAALVVYCFKELAVQPAAEKLYSLAAGAAVVFLHIWKRNTLLSIAGGTIIYMLLIRI
ncbi:MAG: AzlD domain-containing protein [Anaerostipes sp.]|nr:AzlD domain-containing protein [Anaerostipes sp.]MBS7007009.1 AzlD domain-containing protein [Anaerostipes sp.]